MGKLSKSKRSKRMHVGSGSDDDDQPAAKIDNLDAPTSCSQSQIPPPETRKQRRSKKRFDTILAPPSNKDPKAQAGDSAQQPNQQPAGDNLTPAVAVPRSLPTPSPTSAPMAAARAIPLLVCSVGNPGSVFANTLHSAGHTVLKKLSERLDYAPYQKSRPHGSGLVSKPLAPSGDGSDWTLWQSTSLMNISGKGVKAAHNTWAQDKAAGESGGKLVIVHDELEKPLGAVNLNVRQGASAKGHNGLKSIMASIGNVPFVRIGVGIGRPVSRESKDVASYVMRKMTPAEKAKVEGCVEEVILKLRELEGGVNGLSW